MKLIPSLPFPHFRMLTYYLQTKRGFTCSVEDLILVDSAEKARRDLLVVADKVRSMDSIILILLFVSFIHFPFSFLLFLFFFFFFS